MSTKPEHWIENYEEALRSQNWETVSPLVHSLCTVSFSNGTVHKGKAQVETAFRKNFTLIESEKYAISNVHWIVTDNGFAVFTFDYEWSGIMNGNHISGSGRGTSSLVNEDGIWLLVSEHLGPKSNP